MIEEKGKAYVLPLRLDGFEGDVPVLSGAIGCLSVGSSEHKKIVDAFLSKIGRKGKEKLRSEPNKEPIKAHILKLKRRFSDKEKNQFLKSSFEEIVNLMEHFAAETQKEHPHFEYEKEIIISRKTLFTLYENEKQVTQFKVLLGGIFWGNSISFSYGNHIGIENNGSMNESISMEEHEGELKLKALDIASFGAERDKLMSPRKVAEYLWKVVCKYFL